VTLTFWPHIWSLVTRVHGHVSTKLKVSTVFVFRVTVNRRHGTERRWDERTDWVQYFMWSPIEGRIKHCLEPWEWDQSWNYDLAVSIHQTLTSFDLVNFLCSWLRSVCWIPAPTNTIQKPVSHHSDAGYTFVELIRNWSASTCNALTGACVSNKGLSKDDQTFKLCNIIFK